MVIIFPPPDKMPQFAISATGYFECPLRMNLKVIEAKSKEFTDNSPEAYAKA
jgi:hypothetical protein